MSAGKLFHNFGPWTENALSKLDESDLGMCSKSRVVDQGPVVQSTVIANVIVNVNVNFNDNVNCCSNTLKR